MEASISSIEGSRCALLAVAIVTFVALVTIFTLAVQGERVRIIYASVLDRRRYENPQSGFMADFNRLGFWFGKPSASYRVRRLRIAIDLHEANRPRVSDRQAYAGRSICP
ncbi:hypothetical protein ACX3P0_03565 [Mesorhizobium sp. A556]